MALRAISEKAKDYDLEIVPLRNRVAELEDQLQNLCARIHRDGGHYAAEHGLKKAISDADLLVANTYGKVEELSTALEYSKELEKQSEEVIKDLSEGYAELEAQNAALQRST